MKARNTRSTSEGLSFPVNQQWRTHVRFWLEQQRHRDGGMSQAALAKAVNISPPTLNGLLSGKYDHSVAVPLINKMVGLPPPMIAAGTSDSDDLGVQLDAALASLDDEGRKVIQGMAESLIRTARALAERSRNSS